MYLPTFWKLIHENRFRMIKEGAPWALSAGFFGKINSNNVLVTWIGYHSLYNWVYSDIFPPKKGKINNVNF